MGARETYAECLQIHRHLDGKTDGCQKFWGFGPSCSGCGCPENFHRVVVEYDLEVVYTECHKIHHNKQGGSYKDGCREFEPGQVNEKDCDVCGCHKSFHRNEIATKVVCSPNGGTVHLTKQYARDH